MATLLHHASEAMIGAGIATTTYWIACLTVPSTPFWILLWGICLIGSAFAVFSIANGVSALKEPVESSAPVEESEEG